MNLLVSAFALYQAQVSPIVRPAIPLFVLLGLWLGLGRIGMDTTTRITTWSIVAGFMCVWYFAAVELTRSGVYQDFVVLMRPLAWVVALIVFIALLQVKRVVNVLDVVPTWWLIAIQTYRALGGFVILMSWGLGRANSSAILPGAWDALVGISAVPITIYLASGVTGGRTAAILFNWFGLADFAVSVVINTLASRGYGMGLVYPAAMIPAFLAPLSAVIHGLSLWQLFRILPAVPKVHL
jgi:hypothetical protein